MTDTPSAMILHATERMDERFIARARRSVPHWRGITHEMPDWELVAMYATAEIEMERRGLLDQMPRRQNMRTP